MKKTLVLLFVVLTAGCIDSGNEEVTPFIEVTTSTPSTSTVETTILPETTMSTVRVTTSTSTTTTVLTECGQVCQRAGYVDGICRTNSMECRLKGEVYNPRGATACARMRIVDTCCCMKEYKNETVKIHYCINC